MKIEALTVALRPRTAWEAVELGTALTRRHARAIWLSWLWLTLPAFALVNALAWAFDLLWLASVAMWWLKPAFDRIPSYVLSRAVFGEAPSPRDTLRAQREWGVGWLLPYLTWRRLGPVRALYLPVDLLEGGRGSEARERRRALGAPVYGVGMLLTTACAFFEAAVYLGLVVFGLIFVPNEYLSAVADRAWGLLQEAPAWLVLASNATTWAATTLIEPFYVGAGFGLYLNRRTEIEAWDIELALRRLRARLLRGVAPVLVLCALGLAIAPTAVHAQARTAEEAKAEVDAKVKRVTPAQVFGPTPADDRSLRASVKRAYDDPTVSPKRTVSSWKKRVPDKTKPPGEASPMLGWLGDFFSVLSAWGLWIVVGVLVALLLFTAPRWIGWFRAAAAREEREPGQARRQAADEPAPPLPDDLAGAIRRLWREERHREALALLYRASVATMVERTGAVLVPGATEAQVLRASRALARGEERDAFARTVRVWQYAAYAQRFPTADDFEALLREVAERFAWNAAPAAAARSVSA
ncbi:MAG TPA: DUF4129 domain-containing protein [Lysobacter sp.]